MSDMDEAFDAVIEIFSWVGIGLGALLAGVALIIYLFDGTWLPVRGVLEESEHGLEKGTLARAVGTDDADEFAAGDVE